MRGVVAIVVSALVTAAVFGFMQRLISGAPLAVDPGEVAATVQIYQPPAERPPPDVTPEPSAAAPAVEPAIAPLRVAGPAAPQAVKAGGPPIGSYEVSVNDIVLASGGGDIFGSGFGSGTGDTWTQPGGEDIARKIAEAEKKGREGYKEVIPFATRQPNVPLRAWQEKINGWVLVAFTVTPQGNVENVRVLDANPRGVFEENVVAAVRDWIYSPEDLDGKKLHLTQRIALRWEDYPRNNTSLK